jgi:hypothetical protein
MSRKNSVKVCVRTRPTQNFAQDNIVIDQEHSTVQLCTSTEDEPEMLNNKTSTFKFKYDHVFHNASQSAVYDLYARDTVQSVVDGINGAIMSYGQTGSGKTFTMVSHATHTYIALVVGLFCFIAVVLTRAPGVVLYYFLHFLLMLCTYSWATPSPTSTAAWPPGPSASCSAR